MNDLNVNDLPKTIAKFFRRYHLVLFMIVVVGSMSVVLLLVNQSLQKSTDSGSATTTATPMVSFDQKTLQRVQQLQSSSSPQQLVLPADQRTNPFVE